jgi:phosphoribosylformylglycinamidine cyclo-ligase
MKIDYTSIIKEMPFIFKWIKNNGNVSDKEMLRTFNCGIGMVLCVAEENVDKILKLIDKRGEHGRVIGHIVEA